MAVMKPSQVPSVATHTAPAPAARHRHHHSHAAASHGAPFHKHLTQSAVTQALQEAITKEAVPGSWQPSLQFIVDHESSGQVGARNSVDTARGLFQLTAASYHLNPHGAASFGNAVEEAQGGIRYIQQRYRTAENAAEFWQRHGWY